ncbi:hypothetical protein NBRC3257_0251 [Gluconobacter thailandicus NBRC 3257]|uniref:Transposase n=1 Tax=Gluconobacter thailandicus NBRC 3257 TaxID=1381097 RepID=A0ABQ0IST1_GLUTH|nr:hypothetical protein NBRC3255_2660 [Gluconobacter thailandicus NBRC 3255]GAD25252.1 hypothetical protein NBRC3257_0251 [Gluconobacter thailandicus NBRC 3257]
MGDRATEGDDGLAQAGLDLDGEDLRPEFENVLRALSARQSRRAYPKLDLPQPA